MYRKYYYYTFYVGVCVCVCVGGDEKGKSSLSVSQQKHIKGKEEFAKLHKHRVVEIVVV